MHWKGVGIVGNAKEWATAHLQVSVVTEISSSMSRQDFVLVGFPRSRPWLFSVVKMSRQRSPYHARDGRDRVLP